MPKLMLGSSKYSRMAKRQCVPELEWEPISEVGTLDDDPIGTQGAVFLEHSSHVQHSGRHTQSTAPTLLSSPAEDQVPLSLRAEVFSGSKVLRPRRTTHKATKSAQAKLQMERSQGATHKVLKLAQVNMQTEQPRRAMLKVHKSVLVEPQTPRVAECPTEVGCHGRGQVFPVMTAASSKMRRGTVVPCQPGTMALWGEMPPEVIRPEH